MSMMSTRTVVGIGAGICATAFAAYCIYFDRKRRSDPEYKKKVLQKRLNARQSQGDGADVEMPNFKDPESVQRFFLKEIKIGEDLLTSGDFEAAVEHLSNAVAVCGQPQQLLQVLQQTLPTQIFQMLMERLPTVSQRMTRNASSSALLEDDVE